MDGQSLSASARSTPRALPPAPFSSFVNAEMLAKARQRGLDVVKVAVRHRPLLRGTSKVSLAELPHILATLLPSWWSRVLFAGEGFFLPSPPWGRGEQ